MSVVRASKVCSTLRFPVTLLWLASWSRPGTVPLHIQPKCGMCVCACSPVVDSRVQSRVLQLATQLRQCDGRVETCTYEFTTLTCVRVHVSCSWRCSPCFWCLFFSALQSRVLQLETQLRQRDGEVEKALQSASGGRDKQVGVLRNLESSSGSC
jgi:hypothetical protein